MNPEQVAAYLAGFERFGMRFGLDRMQRLMTALGQPQARFRSIHVVGTNGKSSTTRMTAALLQAHGLRTAAYLSPHLCFYTERLRFDGRDIDEDAFAEAVTRAAWATERVNRTLADDDRVTQFEVLTAAAYWAIAHRDVEVAVIEAGLGGRYDATSVIDSEVQVLTSVGLEHTRWLGPTRSAIASEKLAVVRPGGALVVGAELGEDLRAQAASVARERSARLVLAPAEHPAAAGIELAARGAYQRRNFANALTAAQTLLGGELDGAAVRSAAATVVPGRFQAIDGDPPILLDGAHNLDGVSALCESLPAFLAGRPLYAVVSILDDKDAAGMLALLLGHCAGAVFTRCSSARGLSPATLVSLASQLAHEDPRLAVEVDWAASPAVAFERAQRLAHASCGVVLATGTIYLLGDLLAAGVPAAAGPSARDRQEIGGRP